MVNQVSSGQILSVGDFERISRLSISANPRFSAQNILFLIAVSRQPLGWISVNVLPEICGFKRDIRIYTNPLKFALEANLCEARKIVGDDGRQILQVRPVPGAFQCVPTKSIDGKTMQSIFSSLRRLLGEFPFYSPLVCLLLSAVYVRNMKSFKLILRLISDNSHSSSIQQMSSDLESCGCIKLKQSDSGMSLSPVWLQV